MDAVVTKVRVAGAARLADPGLEVDLLDKRVRVFDLGRRDRFGHDHVYPVDPSNVVFG